MITLDAPDVYGHCIFCDDVRPEASGKLIFVGVYATNHMFVHEPFPFTLPHLVVSISYSQLPEKFISPRFWIFFPGDANDKPSIEAIMPEEAGREALSKITSSVLPVVGSAKKYANVQANFTIHNLTIQMPGLLRVRAVRGQELVRLGSLFVRPAIENQRITPTAGATPS